MTALDCEACDALLIDLVERELDEARAAEVRAHADGCESCGRSLARLETGRRAARELVRAEPPRLDAVMAAARARAAEVRALAVAEQARSESIPAPAAPSAPEKKVESWTDTALRWLGTWATRPQVAMAALLVLMVGIGVFNLPQFRSREGADSDGALVEPDLRAEMGPSALDPADPLELAVDPRTQRVALGGAEQDAVEQERGATEPAHDERPTTTLAAPADGPSIERQASTAERHVTAETAEAQALAVTDLAPSDGVGRVEDGPLPDVPAATDQAAVVLAPSTPSSTPTASTHAPSTMPHPSAPPRSDEVEPPSTSMAAALPAAILHQARALASAGHCDEAVPRFRTLLAEHPDYAEAPRAMIELAECDRRLGRLDDAERWLVRAETFPSVSADARRMRTRIATEQRAVDHAGSSSSDQRGATAPSEASSY